jgi:hypothetical protein
MGTPRLLPPCQIRPHGSNDGHTLKYAEFVIVAIGFRLVDEFEGLIQGPKSVYSACHYLSKTIRDGAIHSREKKSAALSSDKNIMPMFTSPTLIHMEEKWPYQSEQPDKWNARHFK